MDSKTFYNALYKGPEVTCTARDLDELGESLIHIRQVRDWSQNDLAIRLGVKQQQVSHWEQNGWQKVSLWRVQEVIEALGLRSELRVTLPAGSMLEKGEEE